MRRNIGPIGCLAFATWLVAAPFVQAQGVPKGIAPRGNAAPRPAAKGATTVQIAPDPRLEQLLKRWEQQSSQLKTLDIMLTRRDRSAAWGDEDFEGRVMLQSPNLAWLDFSKLVPNEADPKKKKLVHEERIICTGNEVWQYKSDTKQIFIFPLVGGAQQRALEEGPLPFLFNMKADDAKRRYQMALTNEDKTSYVIRVIPRLEVDQQAFSKALIQLNREKFLPTRIFLYSPDGKSSKDFIIPLETVKENVALAPVNFIGKDPGKPWQLVRNPGGGQANPQPGRAARPRPGQPAMRPGDPAGRR
jgi:TIGR03009 family protein